MHISTHGHRFQQWSCGVRERVGLVGVRWWLLPLCMLVLHDLCNDRTGQHQHVLFAQRQPKMAAGALREVRGDGAPGAAASVQSPLPVLATATPHWTHRHRSAGCLQLHAAQAVPMLVQRAATACVVLFCSLRSFPCSCSPCVCMLGADAACFCHCTGRPGRLCRTAANCC